MFPVILGNRSKDATEGGRWSFPEPDMSVMNKAEPFLVSFDHVRKRSVKASLHRSHVRKDRYIYIHTHTQLKKNRASALYMYTSTPQPFCTLHLEYITCIHDDDQEVPMK